MSKPVKSYVSFTRTERMGLLALSGLLVILIGIRATMHFWAKPAVDTEKQAKLTASWEAFKKQSAAQHTADSLTKEYTDATDAGDTPLPATIDINTADSATLVRLKGIGPATAGKIIAYRTKHGGFTHIDQLKEMGHFPKATFEMLKKHLTIGPKATKNH